MMQRVVLIVSALIWLTACSSLWDSRQTSGSSSSLVSFLYPGGERVERKIETAPALALPLRVGLAWIPSPGSRAHSTEMRQRLLQRVAEHFSKRSYIDRVEIIPAAYLQRSGGFESLQQLGRLYDFDVMALVSHDQLLQSDDRELSILYWTIVGGYLIPGTKNSVNTFVDTAVFDLRSTKLLLRAPGMDRAGRRSTAVEAGSARGQLAAKSFARAFDDMVAQLDLELDGLSQRIKDGQSDVSVSYREGYGGSGSLDWLWLLLALGVLALPRPFGNRRA